MANLWWLEQQQARVQRLETGGGQVHFDGRRVRLALPRVSRERYGDAQLHDYAHLPRARYRWRPPLALSVRARMSRGVRGTAGFGFWNNPLAPRPALPRAAWFLFASPPSSMELAQGVAGNGWKAATIDAGRNEALVWAPPAPLVLLLCRRPAWRDRLWPRVQRALAVDEALLAVDPGEWHTYDLIWLRDRVLFGVDGHEVLRSNYAPRGPLGLVVWIDNQWARVTPAGSFGWGLLEAPGEQWLELEDLHIVHA